MRKAIVVAACALLSSSLANAWDGYDYDKGRHVEIGKGQLVRPGRTVEVYDYGRGEYRDFDIDHMQTRGRGVTIEATDSDTGESRTFEMD